jgi:hypothetical protein
LLSFAATREEREREREREELFLPVLKLHHHHAFVVLQLKQASQLSFAVQSIVIICRHKRKERGLVSSSVGASSSSLFL